jgi:hypothetical protein
MLSAGNFKEENFEPVLGNNIEINSYSTAVGK